MIHTVKIFFLFFPIFSCAIHAQNYHPLHGSPYAGSVARFNNPASPVLSAYDWEFSPISAQLSLASNNLWVDTTGIRVRSGLFRHQVHGNADIGLMNGMVKLTPRLAVSAGIRARTYNHYRTQPVAISDTSTSLFSFLRDNRSTPGFGGHILHQGWIEGDINLSNVIHSDRDGRLSIGITLQIMKGLSGAFLNLRQVNYQEFTNPPDTVYVFSGGSGRTGLSSVYDPGNDIQSFRDVLNQSKTSLGVSWGLEYIRFDQGEEEEGEEGKKFLQYNWKFGLSVLDLGVNRFQYASYSRGWANPYYPLTNGLVEDRLSGSPDLSSLIDSVNSLFSTVTPFNGMFRVSLPTKVVINFDKKIYKGIYLNANLSLNLLSDENQRYWRTSENNLLAITPRWESRAFGLFFPVQLTQLGEVWLGAALKIGPLTLGIHQFEMTRSFAREPRLAGGGYALLSIHPFSKKKILSRMACWEK